LSCASLVELRLHATGNAIGIQALALALPADRPFRALKKLAVEFGARLSERHWTALRQIIWQATRSGLETLFLRNVDASMGSFLELVLLPGQDTRTGKTQKGIQCLAVTGPVPQLQQTCSAFNGARPGPQFHISTDVILRLDGEATNLDGSFVSHIPLMLEQTSGCVTLPGAICTEGLLAAMEKAVGAARARRLIVEGPLPGGKASRERVLAIQHALAMRSESERARAIGVARCFLRTALDGSLRTVARDVGPLFATHLDIRDIAHLQQVSKRCWQADWAPNEAPGKQPGD
jgi:hypothetical protein